MLQMCGPTGIGFLYGKTELLNAMPPFLGKYLSLCYSWQPEALFFLKKRAGKKT